MKLIGWKEILSLMLVLFSMGALAQGQTQLSGLFVATVRMGPDKDLKLQGTLKLNVQTNGVVTGVLEVPNSAAVKVSGTVVGQSISLVFDLGGKYIFGNGGIDYDIFHDPDVMGGTLSGPGEGDIGDWGFTVKR